MREIHLHEADDFLLWRISKATCRYACNSATFTRVSSAQHVAGLAFIGALFISAGGRGGGESVCCEMFFNPLLS